MFFASFFNFDYEKVYVSFKSNWDSSYILPSSSWKYFGI